MFEAIITDVKRGNFVLEQDALKGMRATIKTGQTRLALEYTENVILSLIDYIEQLEQRIVELEKQPRTKATPAAAKAKTAEADAE